MWTSWVVVLQGAASVFVRRFYFRSILTDAEMRDSSRARLHFVRRQTNFMTLDNPAARDTGFPVVLGWPSSFRWIFNKKLRYFAPSKHKVASFEIELEFNCLAEESARVLFWGSIFLVADSFKETRSIAWDDLQATCSDGEIAVCIAYFWDLCSSLTGWNIPVWFSWFLLMHRFAFYSKIASVRADADVRRQK